MTNRRFILKSSIATLATALHSSWWLGVAKAAETYTIKHTDAEWRKILTPNQFAVLRQNDTERPFTSALLHEKRQGSFACAGCELPLFSSTTKFDSGTGWPSFWKPLEKSIETVEDNALFMLRTAVSCRRCGGHQGHVFNDGPKPTGLRYCINGVALIFKPHST